MSIADGFVTMWRKEGTRHALASATYRSMFGGRSPAGTRRNWTLFRSLRGVALGCSRPGTKPGRRSALRSAGTPQRLCSGSLGASTRSWTDYAGNMAGTAGTRLGPQRRGLARGGICHLPPTSSPGASTGVPCKVSASSAERHTRWDGGGTGRRAAPCSVQDTPRRQPA